MQNKNYLRLLLILLALTALLLLASCDTPENGATEAESESETAVACAHENTYWTTVTAATCESKGAIEKLCRVCGVTLDTADTPLLPHRETVVKGVAATCTADGLTDGKKCESCDAILVAQTVIPKKAHTETTVPGRFATCTTTGLSPGKKCSVCSTVLEEQTETPALSHAESGWIVDKSATAETEGSKHTECILCGTTMKTEKIPTVDAGHTHVGSHWSVTSPASCKQTGTELFLCECGEVVDQRELPLLPHTEQTLPAKEATCMEKGLTEGKKCSVCGEVLKAQRELAMKNHTPQTVLGHAPSCTESGLSDGSVCYVCTTPLSSQVILPPAGHKFSSGVCLNCGIPTPQSVWIVDGLGNPVSDVYVRIMQGEEQIKMVAYDGEFLELTGLDKEATYTLVLDLSSLGDDYVYDEKTAVITPDSPCAAIRVHKRLSKTETNFVGGTVSKDYDMYLIGGEGSYTLPLSADDYTYFIFTPKHAAIYTLTYEAESELSFEYRGSSFFVQAFDVSEDFTSPYENGIAFSIYATDIGGDRVFAIKSEGATECILKLKNAGDPGTRIEDEPWTPYLEDEETVAAQLALPKPQGTYTALDLYDLTLSAHYNEKDGYYHLGSADGDLIYIDLTSNSRYINAIQTICANQRMGVYVYDDFGGLLEKRSFNELFIQYGMPTDTTPVNDPIRVPLTERLAEAIRSYGEKVGWWKEGAAQNLFTTSLPAAAYNAEYAWLLFCGVYVE